MYVCRYQSSLSAYFNLCLLLLCCIYFRCTPKPDASDKTIFKYNEKSGITSLDPVMATNLANIRAVTQIFNGLVQFDAKLNVVPCIAKRWRVDSAKTVWTFVLRNDVFFHPDDCFKNDTDRKVTAKDFVFSFKRVANAPRTAWLMENVAQNNGKLKLTALNDTLLQIKLKKPFVQFIALLASPYMAVVPQKAVKKYKKDFGRHPVGTGPFKFRKWQPNQKLILSTYGNYFESTKQNHIPKIDGISISFYKNPQTVLLQFLQGKLSVLSGLDPVTKDQLLTYQGQLKPRYSNKYELSKCPYLNTEYIGFQLSKQGPFKNKWLRKAIGKAINKEQLILYTRKGIGKPSCGGFIPTGLMGALVCKRQNPKFNLQQLIEKAGYATATEVPPFKIYIDPNYTDIFTAIVNQLNKKGFRVALEVLDRATLKSEVAKASLTVFRGSWIADYPAAENFFSIFYSKNFTPGGSNYTHFSNAEFDSLYRQCHHTFSTDTLQQIYLQMNRIIAEEMPVIPIYFDESIRVYPNHIKGLKANPLNLFFLKNVEM